MPAPFPCLLNTHSVTEYNSKSRVNEPPYINGAYPKCNMFTILETSKISDNDPLYSLRFF